jgi:hypothetical protein
MIKPSLRPAALTYNTNSDMDLGCPSRLLVLVPTDIDYSAATRRIWKLAKATRMHVQLLGLCKDKAEEPGLRRGLFIMASLLQDDGIFAEAKVDIGTNWVNVVKTCYEAGDVIVCFAEQRTGLLRRPLRQVLESNFKATVYILSSLALQKPKLNMLSQVGAWLGFIGIITAFGILQTNVVGLPEGPFQNSLLMLSIIPEFWLIWVWGGWFG